MPLYEKLTAKNKKAWAMFKVLQKIRDEAFNKLRNKIPWNKIINSRGPFGWDLMCEVVNNLPKNKEWKKMREALEELKNNAANYGSSYTFEFNKANLGVSQYGELVLRDVLFDLEKTWGKK